jgi:flagellar basal body-associated protein FliL
MITALAEAPPSVVTIICVVIVILPIIALIAYWGREMPKAFMAISKSMNSLEMLATAHQGDTNQQGTIITAVCHDVKEIRADLTEVQQNMVTKQELQGLNGRVDSVVNSVGRIEGRI